MSAMGGLNESEENFKGEIFVLSFCFHRQRNTGQNVAYHL